MIHIYDKIKLFNELQDKEMTIFLVTLVLTTLALCTSFNFAPSRMVKASTSTLRMGNLVENIQFVKHFNRFTFKTLYKCVAAAGLTEVLAGDGPFTLFAPTDAAFDVSIYFGTNVISTVICVMFSFLFRSYPQEL